MSAFRPPFKSGGVIQCRSEIEEFGNGLRREEANQSTVLHNRSDEQLTHVKATEHGIEHVLWSDDEDVTLHRVRDSRLWTTLVGALREIATR